MTIELYEGSTNKVTYVKLRKLGDSVNMYLVDSGGYPIDGGSILNLTEGTKGLYLNLHDGVDDSIISKSGSRIALGPG